MRKIVFYRDSNGKNPIGEFLDSLPPKDAENTAERNQTRRDTESRLGEEKRISDLNEYIEKRKQSDPEFAEDYESGYENFKIGEMLKQARLERGLTQEELAARLHTKKTSISRIENHAEDIRLSTLERYARALDKELRVAIG